MSDTKHTDGCKRVFKHYDLSCPRCVELSGGAKPRAGWNDFKIRQEQVEREYHKAHFAPGGPHDRGVCGPVCTFGDW